MSVENIDSETIQSNDFEVFAFDDEKTSTPNWNGRCVSHSQHLQQMKIVRDEALHHVEADSNTSLDNREIEVTLCGDSVDGEVSVRGGADSEGNKSGEVEVKVESKDGTVSGSVSGGISQDKDGNTTGKVEGEVTVRF